MPSKKTDLLKLAKREKTFSTEAKEEAKGAAKRAKQESKEGYKESAKDSKREYLIDKAFAGWRKKIADKAKKKANND